jgi:hypothetical protein
MGRIELETELRQEQTEQLGVNLLNNKWAECGWRPFIQSSALSAMKGFKF